MEGARIRLLQCLNRHGFRTGTEMGAALGLSRAAVHKHIQSLVDQGVPIHRVRGRGYRLAEGIVLLDEHAIARQLSERARASIGGIQVVDEVDSTSTALMRSFSSRALHGRVCLAERQTAGRGRRGRSWVASPYRDLMMSVGIEYPQWPAHLPTLGLVTALTIVRALKEQGVPDLMLKWPNDVVHEHRKVCGVLLDVAGEAHGVCRVVVGVGINVSMNSPQAAAIRQRWTDLETIIGRIPDRNTVAAQCLNRLLPAFEAFPANEFAAYHRDWLSLDALRNRWVTVSTADGATLDGKAVGIDQSGRLLVAGADGDTRVFTQGDVSVRIP